MQFDNQTTFKKGLFFMPLSSEQQDSETTWQKMTMNPQIWPFKAMWFQTFDQLQNSLFQIKLKNILSHSHFFLMHVETLPGNLLRSKYAKYD